MQILIESNDSEENLWAARDLSRWIVEANIPDVHAYQNRASIGEGCMGGELLPAIAVVLGAPGTAVIINCIKDWMLARRPRIKINIKHESTEISIDADNVNTIDDIINKIVNKTI